LPAEARRDQDEAREAHQSEPLIRTPEERQALEKLARERSMEARIVERAKMVLLLAEGASDGQVAKSLRTTSKTVRKWSQRYPQRRTRRAGDPVEKWLADNARVGRPDKFDEQFWVDVLAIATSNPEDSGRPITHWTAHEMADEVVKRGLTKSIHPSTISRFLATCALQPHRTEQWMNRKADPEFEQRAADVKNCLVQAVQEPNPSRVVVSFDEKTGMQAKERIAPDKPMQPGQPARLEFEYDRHGTLALLAMMQVHSGEVHGVSVPERTNPVTAQVLTRYFENLLARGYQAIDLVLDQLNTHYSIDLVQGVARLCDLPVPPNKEIKTGAQRRAWLGRPDKPIVFHYTPRHASWLNPIEIWFGVLMRKVLRRGSFSSTTDLAARVDSFIRYYNETLAHPYRFRQWKRRAA
jgi:transposase